MKKGILAALTTAAVAGLGLWLSVPGYADDPAPTYGNWSSAIAAAPQGVDLSTNEYSNYFDKGESGSGGTTGSNSAKVLGKDDGVGSPSGEGNSVIQISRANVADSWGAIWSESKVFDLSKPETASMWIYTSGEKTGSIGDGMTFVLQNDGRGPNAFAGTKTWGSADYAKTLDVPGTGESMGAWGVDPEEYDESDLYNSAIQNSWALEFDTHNNEDTPPSTNAIQLALGQYQWDLDQVQPSSFDLGEYFNSFDSDGQPTGNGTAIPKGENHIASGYPADPGTYTSQTQTGIKTTWSSTTTLLGKHSWMRSPGKYYYYKMKHLGYLGEGQTGYGMTDHRWHHITLNYTPPTGSEKNGSMTYTFNDKNAVTGAPQASTDTMTVPIILDNFKLGDSTKVFWGFTGSTGEDSENNLVVFDQLPGEAEVSSTATLSAQNGDSDEYIPVETNSTPTLFGGTPVKLEYKFQRDGGLKDWANVNATLNVPKSITLTSGEINNPDGTKSDVDLTKRNGTTLPVALGSGGKGVTLTDNQSGSITLYGTVGSSAASESAATSYFQGDNASSAAKLPAFNVKASDLTMTIAPEESTTSVDYGDAKQPAEIVGQAKYPYGPAAGDTAMSPEDIVVHLKVNGHIQGSKALPSILRNPGSDPWSFQYEVDNSLLKKGANTITLYSTSKFGGSNEDSTTVTAGTLGYGDTSGNLVFAPTVLSGTTTTIERANDWSFYIDDSRQSGDWYLSAKTTGMTLDTAVDTRLDGNLIYVDSDGTTQTLNADDATLIDSGKADGTDKKTNIASDWGPKQGILLRVNGSAMQGDYSGEIIWNLSNAPS